MSAVQTVLHPTDFSDHSRAALELAASVARKEAARLVVLHVVPDLGAIEAAELRAGHRPSEHFEEDMAGYRREMRGRLESLPVPDGPARVERLFREGPPADTIVRAAEELACDLVVMGTHGKRGVERVLMGSVAEHVMRHAPCPVVTVRLPPPH